MKLRTKRIMVGAPLWCLAVVGLWACLVEETSNDAARENVGVAQQAALGQACTSDAQCGAGELCCDPPPGVGGGKKCAHCCSNPRRGCSTGQPCGIPCDTSWYFSECCNAFNPHYCDHYNTCHVSYSSCITNCVYE